MHTITETYTSDKNKNVRSAYVRIKTHIYIPGISYHMLNESQQNPKPRRAYPQEKDSMKQTKSGRW